jgi:trans-aconitate methyltransferase
MNRSTAWNPESYARNARFVSDLGEPLLQLLVPKPNESILDLGCGDGALTEKVAAAGCGVVGIDSSPAQLRAARGRGLDVIAMDGERLVFRGCFDAVFTNAALHWMKRPALVVEGVANCLKANGRFVGEFGGRGNVEAIRAALHAALGRRGVDPWKIDPWYYPSPDEYSELLKGYGLTVEYIELIPRLTKLPGDITAWLEIFAQPFSKSLAESERSEFVAEVRRKLKSSLKQSDGTWYADYIRLRFKATR